MASGHVLRRQRVIELVGRHVPAGGRVLEVSCGDGAVLRPLRDAGFIVRGTNYTQYPDADASLDIDTGVDLIQGLPYPDGAFDCVILLDIIEHLSDHHAAVRHVARVLKDGGCAIIVTPNTMRLSSRLHFLLTGFFKVKRAFIGFDVPADRAFAFHNHPVHLPILLYLLRAAGLGRVELGAVQCKLKSIPLWLAMWPCVALATRWTTGVAERHLKGTDAADLLNRTLLSFPGLCGESMVLTAWKSPPGADEAAARRTDLPKWSKPIQRDPLAGDEHG